MNLSRTTKKVAIGAIVGFGVGYALSTLVLKGDKKASLKKGLLLAALGGLYQYTLNPNIEVMSNASGKRKEKDVASPKGKKYPPLSWYQDSNGRYHWVNKDGKWVD